MKSNYIEEMTKEAVAILQKHEPPEGYLCAFSGGKDSMVIYDLLKKSGCKFDAHYSFTSVDPPELTQFIKDNYPDVIWHKPELTMFQLIEKWGFPSRQKRYCCSILKETLGKNRIVVTGVRKQESVKRNRREMFETSINDKTKQFLNIIINWSFNSVWEYIKLNKLPYCKLYDEGWHRIGCIGCPIATYKQKVKHFNRYPNFKKAYLESWRRHIVYLDSREKTSTLPRDPEKAFDYWIRNVDLDTFNEDDNQLKFDF